MPNEVPDVPKLPVTLKRIKEIVRNNHSEWSRRKVGLEAKRYQDLLRILYSAVLKQTAEEAAQIQASLKSVRRIVRRMQRQK